MPEENKTELTRVRIFNSTNYFLNCLRFGRHFEYFSEYGQMNKELAFFRFTGQHFTSPYLHMSYIVVSKKTGQVKLLQFPRIF